MFWLITLFACSSDPTQGNLSDNVGRAFARCAEKEIKFLANKHNVQPVFEPCGSNNFAGFSWSPDGMRVYFQLGTAGYVMEADAADKRTTTLPTSSPIGRGDWITSTRVVVPVRPAEGTNLNRIVTFDVEQNVTYDRTVDRAQILKVMRSETPNEVFLVTRGGKLPLVEVANGTERTFETPTDAPLRLERAVLDSDVLQPAFSWLKDGFDSVDVTLLTTDAEDRVRVVVGRGTTVTVHEGSTGTVLHTFEKAESGTLHPEGDWLALEHTGDPISAYYQRTWDDMTEAQKRRQQKRADQLAERLPDHFAKTVSPPVLSFADLRTGKRHAITSLQGSSFEWYVATPYWGSYVSWGFESKQFKKNVMLGDMGIRLRSIEKGREFMGVEPMDAPSAP